MKIFLGEHAPGTSKQLAQVTRPFNNYPLGVTPVTTTAMAEQNYVENPAYDDGKQIPNPCFMYGRNSEKNRRKQLFSMQFSLNPPGENKSGKSSVDMAHLIVCTLEKDLRVYSSSDPFVCNRCYKLLLRFE